jgi:hypothetical protein
MPRMLSCFGNDELVLWEEYKGKVVCHTSASLTMGSRPSLFSVTPMAMNTPQAARKQIWRMRLVDCGFPSMYGESLT